MLSRFCKRFRSWQHLSSAHLNQIKDPPKVPLFFTDRKLVVRPVLKELPKERLMNFTFVPQEVLPVPVAPYTRFPEEEKKLLPDRKFCVATRKRLNISIKKLNRVCMHIRGIHTMDALAKLEPLRYKCAPWLAGLIRGAIYNGVVHKGFDGERLYVSQIVLGKNRPIRGKRYAAKGRSFQSIKPYSQVTIILEEKSVEELYKIIVTGKFSPTLANMVRNKFLVENVDLSVVRKYQNLLTAKGRQQQHLMFKRRVMKKIDENKQKGLYVSAETVEKRMLEEESKEFSEKYWANKRRFAEERIAARQSIYMTNEGI